MAEHVCPWWLGYFLIVPIRRWLQDPAAITKPYVRAGMTVLEPGPGMGFFTLELAKQVGPNGRVVAVDVQPKMIAKLKRRAEKSGLALRIDARLAAKDSMALEDLRGKVDFTLAFCMVHEMPSASRFFQESAELMKAGATLLLAEPTGHVKKENFDEELRAAEEAGFSIVDRPPIRRSLTAILQKGKV